jgi:hypothetical protein
METLIMTPEQARREWAMRRDLGPTQRLSRGQGRTVWTPPADPFAFVKPALRPKKPAGAQTWVELLDAIIADGTQISNSTTETIVCPDFSIPARHSAPGRMYQIEAFGVLSNVVTTPGTVTFRVRWGGVSGTVLVASAALALDTTAHTNFGWYLKVSIVCRSAGATGTFMTGGHVQLGDTLVSTAANLLPTVLPASGNAAVTVDTTTAKDLSLTAQFSVATSPTNLTAQHRAILLFN